MRRARSKPPLALKRRNPLLLRDELRAAWGVLVPAGGKGGRKPLLKPTVKPTPAQAKSLLTAHKGLKLILMSATVHTDLYSQYFKEFDPRAPIAESSLFVGSRRFPVKEHHAQVRHCSRDTPRSSNCLRKQAPERAQRPPLPELQPVPHAATAHRNPTAPRGPSPRNYRQLRDAAVATFEVSESE